MLLCGFQSLATGLSRSISPTSFKATCMKLLSRHPAPRIKVALRTPVEHLLDTPCLRGLHIHAHQFRQGLELLLR